jgi:hypothetical protein
MLVIHNLSGPVRGSPQSEDGSFPDDPSPDTLWRHPGYLSIENTFRHICK